MIQHSLIVMAKVFQFVSPSLLAVPISRSSRWNVHKRWWLRVLLMVWLGQRAECWKSNLFYQPIYYLCSNKNLRGVSTKLN